MAEAEKDQQQAAAETAADESLVGSILQETLKMKPADEEYAIARQGMAAFIAELMTPERKGERIQQKMVDEMIAEIDQKMSKQLDQILHHETFQKMESAWRGLKFVVDRTDFRENIKVEVINVSKQDLLDDFAVNGESGKFAKIDAPDFIGKGEKTADFNTPAMGADKLFFIFALNFVADDVEFFNSYIFREFINSSRSIETG